MPAKPSRIRVTLNGLLEAAVAVCFVGTMMGLAGRLAWIFDLASHFPVQQAAFLGLVGATLVMRRRWAWGSAAAILAVVNLAAFASDWIGRPPAPETRSLRVVSLNVFIKSHQYVDVAAMLDGEKPDVVALIEVNARWADALLPLRVRWPHVISEPREKSFGMMLLSRAPILESSVVELGDTGRVTLRARIATPDGPITLLVFHPPPPMGPDRSRRRDEETRALAELVRAIEGPVLVVGDFNCTPWSGHFRDLLRDSGLRDSRKGFGVQASWPSPLLPLMIPIDHALVSDGVAVVDRRFGPRVGSDHLPLIVDVALAPPLSNP
jgi:endonuclease/exonuclease/phosphatase (EEP) superfamily protein YafD